MPDLDVVSLVDHDLSPLHERYEALASMLSQIDRQVDPETIRALLDGVNQQFGALLMRLEQSPAVRDIEAAAL